jgi:hypothetical protein
MNIDYEVEYFDDGDFENPNISFYLDTQNIKCNWIITNANPKFLELWKNMRTCMISNKKSDRIGGSGYWNCGCDGENFIIEYDVSDEIDADDVGSHLYIIIPNSKMISYIDKIIDVLEHAKQNKCYPNSTILNE